MNKRRRGSNVFLMPEQSKENKLNYYFSLGTPKRVEIGQDRTSVFRAFTTHRKNDDFTLSGAASPPKISLINNDYTRKPLPPYRVNM